MRLHGTLGRRYFVAACFTTAILTISLAAVAQTATPPAEPVLAPPSEGAQPYKLHVSTTLVQVPTLITDRESKPIAGLRRNDVKISLDEGPLFAPTMLRLEGDDPISLTVVLDVSGDQRTMLRTLSADLAKLSPTLFRPADRVTFYALDCILFRASADNAPTADVLQREVDDALNASGLHGDHPRQGCRRTLHIIDALTHVVSEMATQPGRRVLVIVSEVRDQGSKVTLSKLSTYAGQKGVAIFGLRDAESHDADVTMGRALMDAGPLHDIYGNDNLAALVRPNGGLIFNVEPYQLQTNLLQLMQDVRSRYILEFARPSKFEAGFHGIDVTVPSMIAFTHPAGVSTSLPDPADLTDPTNIPTADSPAVMGTHRPRQP